MALSLGVFTRLYSWVTDRDNAVKIRADRMDAEFDGIATALSTAMYKDGQQTVTANIPMNSKKFTGLAAGSTNGDSIRYEQISGAIVPAANDGGALGDATHSYSDLFLAAGGVINWANGDVTITNSTNLLAFAGASLGYTFDGPMVFGHTAQLAIANTDNVQIVGATTATTGLGMLSFVNGGQAHVDFYSSPSGVIGTYAPVVSGGALGALNWYGAQQTGAGTNWSRAAQIRAEVNGTVTDGAGADMPGRIIVSVSPDGSATIAEVVRWTSTGETLVGLLDISNAASGQIKFPATANPSADANTFDDYEEGTFSPIVAGSSTAGTTTNTAGPTGVYTKIGNLVTFNTTNGWSNQTGTGFLQITGLPFTANASYLPPLYTWYDGLTLAAGQILFARVGNSSTTIVFHAGGTGLAVTPQTIDTAVTNLNTAGFYYV